MRTTAMENMFKDLKRKFTSYVQKERCFPIRVPSRLNELRANDRWVCWK